MRFPVLPCAVALCVALTACASSSPTHYYTLNAPALAPTNAAASISVAVGPASVAEGLDRPQLVVRRTPQRADVLEEHRWLDSPKREIPRVLSANLAALMPGLQFAAHSQQAASHAPWQILLDVQSFEARPGEAVSIDLVWTLRRESLDQRDTPRRSWRISASEPLQGSSPDAIVAAWSKALAKLAAQMAEQMRLAGVS